MRPPTPRNHHCTRWPPLALPHPLYTLHPSFWSTPHTPLGGDWLPQIFSSTKEVIWNNSNTNNKALAPLSVFGGWHTLCIWAAWLFLHRGSHFQWDCAVAWRLCFLFQAWCSTGCQKGEPTFQFSPNLRRSGRGVSKAGREDGNLAASNTSQAGLTTALWVGGRQAAGGVPGEGGREFASSSNLVSRRCEGGIPVPGSLDSTSEVWLGSEFHRGQCCGTLPWPVCSLCPRGTWNSFYQWKHPCSAFTYWRNTSSRGNLHALRPIALLPGVSVSSSTKWKGCIRLSKRSLQVINCGGSGSWRLESDSLTWFASQHHLPRGDLGQEGWPPLTPGLLEN